jgi:hypothetical protein
MKQYPYISLGVPGGLHEYILKPHRIEGSHILNGVTVLVLVR